MRSFLENLAWRLQRFMQGRNGVDDLGRACYWVAIVLLVLNLFAGNAILNLLVTATVAYSLFRMISTNLPARQHENVVYLEKSEGIRRRLSGMNLGGSLEGIKKEARQQVMRFKSRKEYKYFKCKCGTTLRVRRGQGTKELICPMCKEHMTRNTN